MIAVLMRDRTYEDTEKGANEQRNRNWSDILTSYRTPRTAGYHPAGERTCNKFCLRASRGNQPVETLISDI